jgi:type IV pilus assembly protein PilV
MQVLSRQRGVSLIEVLVAIVIFSVGVLGIALMQIKGAQYSKQAGARTVAVLQARSLADAMRANPAGVFGVADKSAIPTNHDLSASYYLYDGATTPSTSDCSSSNDPCKQAKRDLLAWLDGMKTGLTGPGATVTNNTTANTGTLRISTSWNAMSPGGASNNDAYQFDFQP